MLKKIVIGICILGAGFTVAAEKILATPSTTYWTPCVMDIQSFGVWHIGIDNYTAIGYGNVLAGRGGGSFLTDFGVTVGILPFEKINMEIGVDLLEPSDYPIYFNAKIGTPEDSIFKGSPALHIGIFNAGLRVDVTDYNIVYLGTGKTLPFSLGRLHAGYYFGNARLLKDGAGNIENQGYLLGYDKYIYKDKVMLAADYASGKNAIGGGGMGLYYFFTKNISLLVGPVWFNDEVVNGKMKWTSQLDINF